MTSLKPVLYEFGKYERPPRPSNSTRLCGDGAALLPQAEKVLASLLDFNQAAPRLHGTLRGVLRSGTILDPAFTRLGAFLKELVESAPQIETELRQGMNGQVLTQFGATEIIDRATLNGARQAAAKGALGGG